MEKIKLVLPAGNVDCLIAAVSNGADAVYLGSKLFNCRRLADNFTADQLKKAVQYAHLYDVEVYLTLNTSIKNREIIPFLKQVAQAERLGIDAVIIQDLTLAPLIREHFPNIRIHASTQAGIMNTPAIEFWKKYIDIFIPARELTKQEIKEMYDRTGVKLEIFAHGHLCSSFSGQCLISSLIGKRSGNRGMCASSCRKQYNGDRYLISAKDLYLLEHIPEIIEAGVHAIKIEGRMKPAEYVATTARYYREQIDSYYHKNRIAITEKTIKNLKLAFNREFTPGYFHGEKSIIDYSIPGKRGILLGRVAHGKLLLQDDLQQFDGISVVYNGKHDGCFIRNIFLDGKEVKNAKKGQKVSLDIKNFLNGASIYRLSPQGGEDLLGVSKVIPFDLKIDIKEKEPLKALFSIKEKNIFYQGAICSSRPQKHPLTAEEVKKEIEKIDSNIFSVRKIEVKTDNSFLPKSELTKLRQAFEEVLLDTLVPISNDKEEKKIELNLIKESDDRNSNTESNTDSNNKIEDKESISKSDNNKVDNNKGDNYKGDNKKTNQKKLHVRVFSLAGAKEAIDAGADIV
ncbi:U32 family peptidase, partial [Candidatus Woesearchaeota archaeon]|nr:U32 family peptidase [Candidatus Woesearchaeota archaeon]